MFRYAGARGCRDERGGRRDVDRPRAVAARTGSIDEVVPSGADRDGALAHRLGEAGDLLDGLASRPQRDEKSSDLRGRCLAVHDLAHDGARLGERQPSSVEGLCDRCLNHACRKFLAISHPSGVSTDSGWNCTPSTGKSRWRTAMTSPSSAVADTSSTLGVSSATSEWYRPASISSGSRAKSPRPSWRTVHAFP